jgi:hypothetical protein
MQKQKEYSVSLISAGKLIESLHYGPYAREWWLARPTNDNTANIPFYPIRLGMKTLTTINKRDFIITVVQGNTEDTTDPNYNEFQPGYICRSEGLCSNVCNSSSQAITSVYQKVFSNKTKHAGPLVMGFDIPHISETLLSDVHFHPFAFKIENLSIMVFSIGVSKNPDWNYAGEGYKSSFIHNYNHSRSLFFQEFDDEEAIVRVYKEFQEICVFRDTNPNLVWKKIGILTKFKGSTLFGLEHNKIKLVIDREKIPYCTIDDWDNEEIMNKVFNYHLKKRVLMSINWKNLFIEWQNQISSIIELTQKLKEIYPVGYIIEDRELRAWKALLRHAGCTKITPFKKEESKVIN